MVFDLWSDLIRKITQVAAGAATFLIVASAAVIFFRNHEPGAEAPLRLDGREGVHEAVTEEVVKSGGAQISCSILEFLFNLGGIPNVIRVRVVGADWRI